MSANPDVEAAGGGGPPHAGLLSQVMSSTLDADYQAAADRSRARGNPRRPGQGITSALVVLLFAMMLAVSALRTEQQRPAAAAERDMLVAQIHARQHRLDDLQTQVSDLEAAVAAAQVRTADRRDAQRQTDAAVLSLAAVAGGGEVTGPGVRVLASDAPGAAGNGAGGVIRAADLQQLANAMWMAGAEAIAINGNRLTSLTAIRFAGQAITVDYRSLMPPYVIEAIGDPNTMPARLLETPGGQAWLGLRQNFGIGFETQTSNSLVLPADTALQLREAEPSVPR
ncbi:MAG: DUF881 domain-containing protein [Pseudonocardiales bacterium]